MSGETFKRYSILSSFFARILRKTRILAIAEEDARRFSSLGALHVAVLGNLKFDALRSTDPGRADQIRTSLPGGGRPIFIAGSVREGEERMVIDAFRYATVRIPNLLALIAPRHPDRVQLLTDVAQEYGLKWGLRSKAGVCDLLIVDTVGELFDLYGAADVAFVGGSLVDLGGQNILEPISWGIPTIHGPHMENFTWALEAVEGNTLLVHDANELGRTIVDVLTQRDRYLPRARKAREALEKARGANELYAKAILEKVF
jgi:3-deoxy-D-manno-octulosonic-acid transferase